MATTFKATRIPNLDLAVEYGTYYGRVKIRGKLIRECLGKTQKAASDKLSAWLVSKRGSKTRARRGTLNSLTERYYGWIDGKEAKGQLDEETITYKKECVAAIRNQWTGFCKIPVDKLTKAILEAWTGA